MDLNLFEYDYPQELIAQHPLPDRDLSRMMVLDRGQKSWRHQQIQDLPSFLNRGDLLVFNDTKVFPARIFGEIQSPSLEGRGAGGRVEILLLEKTGPHEIWKCLAKPLRKLHVGKTLHFSENLDATVVKNSDDELILKFESQSFTEEIEKIGLPPLPPYIQRKSAGDYTEEDRERYQSIFAKHKGSAAAPTASFHFSHTLIEKLKTAGVETAHVTLHVSRDTFLPIREEDVTEHKMHGERFLVPESTQKKIAETKKNGGRVIAVGTTATRALESDWSQPVTHHYIYPGYQFKVIDGMLTNFHQPASTLLLMVSAFAGRELIMASYKEAIAKQYRLFSYGDCMLLL